LTACIKCVVDKLAVGHISEHDIGTIRDALAPLFGEGRLGWSSDYLMGDAIGEKCQALHRLFDLTSSLGIFESAEPIWASETLNVPPMVTERKLGTPIRSLREVRLKQ
jgi:hypothetical protein